MCLALSATALADKRVDRRYAIITNTAENRALIKKCIEKKVCIQTSLSTIRKSCDGTKGIVKFNRAKLERLTGKLEPSDFKDRGITWMTHTQIKALITDNPVWECGGL